METIKKLLSRLKAAFKPTYEFKDGTKCDPLEWYEDELPWGPNK